MSQNFFFFVTDALNKYAEVFVHLSWDFWEQSNMCETNTKAYLFDASVAMKKVLSFRKQVAPNWSYENYSLWEILKISRIKIMQFLHF
jgi:hypothetical protein